MNVDIGRPNTRRLLWLPISIAVLTSLACGSSAGSEGGSDEVVEIVVIVDPVIHDSLEELLDRADAVVIATFTGDRAEKIIPERDPNNPDRIHPDRSGFGSVYDFTVERYLMGEGPDLIGFYQAEGILISGPSGETRAGEIINAFPPPVVSQRYLLMISVPEYTPEIVVGPAQPFRFLLIDGLAKPDSSNRSILERFPAEPEADFIERVEAAIRAP